jgi:hypothetical protein
MALYLVRFDGEPDYIEAGSFVDAIAIWRRALISENEPGDFDDTVQPESVELVHEGPVWRAVDFCSACGSRWGVGHMKGCPHHPDALAKAV